MRVCGWERVLITIFFFFVCLLTHLPTSPHTTPTPQSADYVCLVRAADAKRKIATSVTAKDAPRFVESYGTILKAHVDGLKKREKAKKVVGGGAGGKK